MSRYLSRIDESRIYTNYGPLCLELEERICGILALPLGSCQSASSGTTALVGAILARAGRATSERPLAIVPAFTFVATALAAEECGYSPFLADVDAVTWMLDPERMLGEVPLDRVGVVIPVAPFGRPVPHDPWRAFSEKTGIPVVIDGAASFDSLANASPHCLSEIPIALSFHATKSFSTGEGGGVITTDRGLSKRIVRALNFGFFDSRDCKGPSVNGKMSEYHAAVGLAELDGWREKLAAFNRVAEWYRKHAEDLGIEQHVVVTPEISACYALFRANDAAQAEAVTAALESDLIDSRWWYGRGLHHQTYFEKAPRSELGVTEDLALRLLGLPLACDIEEESIARIVTRLGHGLKARL
ncbi:MAG: DegT/DnrJ/EryC1/StrS family aminotransferase [Candidatus Tumulicola sp.]